MALVITIYYRFNLLTNYRGTYEIEPRAIVTPAVIDNCKIVIEIQPDCTKPVEMKVKHGNKSVFNVKDKLPGIET